MFCYYIQSQHRLRQNQNAAEYQNARGLGSGNVAQSRLARDTAATDALTQLRRAQMASDAAIGAQKIGAEKTYGDAVTDLSAENQRKRAQAMYAEALTQMPKTNPVYTDEEEQKKKGTGASQFLKVAKDAADFINAGNTSKINSLLAEAERKEGTITAEQREYLNHLKNIYV